MRSFLVFFSCIILLPILNGQSDDVPAEISWGEELREPSGTYISKLVSYGSWGFFALRKKEDGAFTKEAAYIERYDADMNLKKSKKLDLKYKGKKRAFEDLVLIGGELYLFTSFNNRAKNKNYLFAQKISRKRLIPEKKLNKVGEIDSRNEYRTGQFDIEISKDSSKVLIYNQLPYKKREPERFALRVFDDQLELAWEKDIVLPYNDELFEVKEYQVDNEGNIYILGVLYGNRSRTQRNGLPTYQYIILTYADQGETVREYKINLREKFITDLTFQIDRNRNLVCSGFYSEKSAHGVKGTYFFRLNPVTEELIDVNTKEFDFEFRSAVLSRSGVKRAQRAEKKDDRRREPELYRYSLDDLILRTDGGALLIAEQYYVNERMYRYWDGGIRYDYFYNYNDIIVVNVRPNGEIEWTARIPKRQETMNDGGYYSSYSKAIVRDRIYFVFNDNDRNYDGERNPKRLYNFNGKYSVIAVTELRKDGSSTTYPLFRNSDAAVITRPKICKQIGLRRMIIFGERGRTYRFGSLDFD